MLLIGTLILAFATVALGFTLVWAPLSGKVRTSSQQARSVMTHHLDEMFIFIPVEHLGTVKLICTSLFTILGFILSYTMMRPGPYVVAAISGVIGYFFPAILIWHLRRKRRARFSEQLVNGLILLSNGLRAGFTMQQAIEMLVEQSRPPLSQEFELVLREHRLGIGIDEALRNCAKRTQDVDLDLATTAVSVTRQLGGNISEIFERLVETIKARKLLEGKVDSLTAQGRMQAVVVAAMPYLFGIATAKVNPELMRLMWTTLPGLGCLFLVVTLDVMGYLWVIKLTKIEY